MFAMHAEEARRYVITIQCYKEVNIMHTYIHAYNLACGIQAIQAQRTTLGNENIYTCTR
jgi:hypothetical protein